MCIRDRFTEIFETQSYIDCVGHPPDRSIKTIETEVTGVSDPSPGSTTIATGITETPDTPVTVDPPSENTTPPQQYNPPSSGGGGGY